MPRIEMEDTVSDWLKLNPALGQGLSALGNAVYTASGLPMRILEAARMRIAIANDCHTCRNARQAKAGEFGIDDDFYHHIPQWRTWSGFNDRERLAIEYAERFAQDHLGLAADDDFWSKFHRHFSDTEISSLAVCCSLWLGAGRTARVLDVGQACQLTLNAVTPY
ncbi:carboxymuconolactone decarboxylase family protein [Denitratisoma oestradiolicum]|uniref:Carboxymuconolactone decarboxylase n=1 Tax=Denitratisoma oestradiolicum TaxID=311182 RepID=A0A6S6XQJ3_9PROT|nr:carboxymuconolactone decarboxylase family protein [Denitratisoma oestradiolicum]TWO79242.1 carboxymuconolactone decarboxylase [Denitratisoma oestradiolicum]CAB1368246.1 Carboxymuconolactone decarboxylase [Denitratisoma oestradiolicum]